MLAKRFFYVSAALLMLAATYHLGAQSASAQAPGNPIVGIAVNTGYYTFSGVRDGQPTQRPARYTLVFRKQDGKWLIVDHHSSYVP